MNKLQDYVFALKNEIIILNYRLVTDTDNITFGSALIRNIFFLFLLVNIGSFIFNESLTLNETFKMQVFVSKKTLCYVQKKNQKIKLLIF